jgi:hypothetical protein
MSVQCSVTAAADLIRMNYLYLDASGGIFSEAQL